MRSILTTFLLTISLAFLSCHKDKIEKIEKCSLTKTNGIKNLRSVGVVNPDSLTLNFENSEYRLNGRFIYVVSKYYNYILNRRSIAFGNDSGDLNCSITLHYPGDSSYFNNSSYLTTKFLTKDYDFTSDSLVYVNQCVFNLYLELTKQSGERFKTTNKSDLTSNFFQIDSIHYIKRDLFAYAQYRIYAHFKTYIVNAGSKEEPISGNLKMLFETKKH